MLVDTPQLDTTIEIVTPENIAFHYRVAGPFRRLPAFLLDIFFKVAAIATLGVGGMFVIGMLGTWLPGLRDLANLLASSYLSLLLVAWFAVTWFYGGFFETYWNGQTPGKYLLAIRVLTTNGKPINGMQAVIRNVMREVDIFLPVVSLVAMGANRRFQRLGDLVTGTIVVVEDRQWLTGIAKLEDPRTASLASFIPADFTISRSLAKTVSAYVERRRFFTPLRRREIARHLAEPLLRQFGMPLDTSHDLLLCAVYHRAFIAGVGEETKAPAPEASPFAEAASFVTATGRW